MYVIADIEWIGNIKNRIAPTQIALVRVDEHWNEISKFSSCIRVEASPDFEQAVAFTGYELNEFANAAPLQEVMRKLSEWLKDDDMICFWYEESERIFERAIQMSGQETPVSEYRIISIQINEELQLKGINKTSLYKVAEEVNVNEGFTPHFSADDVGMIIEILKNTDISQELFRERIHLPEKTASGDTTTGKTSARKKNRTLAYKLQNGEITQKEYNKHFLEKRTDIAFIRAGNSNVFHRATCGIPLRSNDLKMYSLFKTCIKNGWRPCKLCCPTQSEEALHPVKNNIAKGEYGKEKEKAKNLTALTGEQYDVKQRALNKEETNAVKRYLKARRERDSILLRNDLTKQEKADLITLSRTDCAFWSAKGYQTFHYRECVKLKNMTFIQGYTRYNEAIRNKVHPCKLCKPSPKKDLALTIPMYSNYVPGETLNTLKARCKRQGIRHKSIDKGLEVYTDVGMWQIDVTSIPYRLYHINKVYDPGNETDFHQQPHIFLSLKDVLFYIIQHDEELEGIDKKKEQLRIESMLRQIRG